MRFDDNEYIVSKAGVPDESITITKKALERKKAHYQKVLKEIPDDHPTRQFMLGLYGGKVGVIIDLLKHFEDEDV